MDLYTCAMGKSFGSLRRRVPILVLEDGAVIVGSAKIVEWAKGHN
ncbi:MAG: glutathione S-transferase N-terminal domain-containing protein [Solirubrobacteraceae bacterium]